MATGETIQWERFTKRTDGLKLIWLEKRLDDREIPHRRNGESWHAPITEVPLDRLDEAWAMLTTVDDDDDDDHKFALDHMGEAYPWDLPA